MKQRVLIAIAVALKPALITAAALTRTPLAFGAGEIETLREARLLQLGQQADAVVGRTAVERRMRDI